VKSLQSLVEQYLLVGHDEYHVYKIRQAFKDVRVLYLLLSIAY